MKKHFYNEQVENIKENPQYVGALLSLYDKLYTEILSWGAHSANVTIGIFVLVFTGIFYGFSYSAPLILVILPSLLGLLCIFLNTVFIWMSTLAFKMAEIEICFQKAKMPLFNWLTKHNILARSNKLTYYIVAFIITIYHLLFFIAFNWVKGNLDYIQKIGHNSTISTEKFFSIANFSIHFDWFISFFVISALIILLIIYRRVRIKLKKLEDHLPKD